jgi:hypothetical protein
MPGTRRYFSCAALFRIWDPVRRGFGFTNQRPPDASVVDVWTGRFDREGRPVYEQDILSVHHDWRLGWVRALVMRRVGTSGFVAQATGPDGVFHVGEFEFAEGYVEGNLHQHPQRLFPAMAQFSDPEPPVAPRWWRSDTLRLVGGNARSPALRQEAHWASAWDARATPPSTARSEQVFLPPALTA